MSATLLYRIATVVLVLFAAGHTLGFLRFRPASAEGRAVFDAMNSVGFDFKGRKYTYAGFYKGFGLMVTAYLLFAACLAWSLGDLAATQSPAVAVIAWAFTATQAACLLLSVLYFFVVPAIFSAVVLVCLGWAAWLVGNVAG